MQNKFRAILSSVSTGKIPKNELLKENILINENKEVYPRFREDSAK